MLFPEVEKVNYKINPVDVVSYQLQFSPILIMDTEKLSALQKQMKPIYPKLSESIISEVCGETKQPLPFTWEKTLGFSSTDEAWKINLTENYLLFSTTRYQGWEEFRDRLHIALKALVDVYRVNRFTTISKRITNLYVRSKLGLTRFEWKYLFNPCILGVLASDDMIDNIENVENISLIGLANRNVLLRIEVKTTRKTENGEICLLLTLDLSEMMERNAVQAAGVVDHLHAGSIRMNRWCIKNRLHNAMEPEKL